jgi:subtilase family serine protease
MPRSWLFRSIRLTRRDNHQVRTRRLGIEPLEWRQLLSVSPLGGNATPDHLAHSMSGATPAATAGPTGYSPQQVRQAYGFNQVTFSNGAAGDGSGETIAIVDAYDDPNIAGDLHQFDAAFGLPDPVFTKVNQTGGSSMPTADKGWATEIALDVEWAHAIAPKANILLVEANSSSFSDLLTGVNYARNYSGVVAVSMSWGGGEFSGENTYDNYFTTPAGHQGVSFFVSSGDNGAPVSYPAASPNVVSVGGTSLYLSSGNYSSESGWSGSGGGISAYETEPGYQKSVVTQTTTMRTNPDVSYDSDPNTGFPVYDSYNNGTSTPWGQWGGTSDAAPQWAALVAIADQGRAISGLGSLDSATQLLPALYQLPASDFHDVTTGKSTGSPSYSATAGYDLVTGRGSPIANLVIKDLGASTINGGGGGGGGTTTAPAAPTNFTGQALSSTQISLSWSLSSGATGYQIYEQSGTQSILLGTVSATTSTATVSGLAAGTAYSFKVAAYNSVGSNATGWLSITTQTAATLQAPTNFAGSATSATTASLSWNASAGATGYSVYELVNGQSTLLGNVGSRTTSVTISGLAPSSTNQFSVTAFNSTASASTGWISITQPAAVVVAAPTNVTVSAASATSATLSWNLSANATGYRIYWLNGSRSVLLGSVGATTSSVTITNLKPGSTYQFSVVAYNGTSTAASPWVTLVMPNATPQEAHARRHAEVLRLAVSEVGSRR